MSFETNPVKLLKGLLHLAREPGAFIGFVGMACFCLCLPMVALMSVFVVFGVSDTVTLGVVIAAVIGWVYMMACIGIDVMKTEEEIKKQQVS